MSGGFHPGQSPFRPTGGGEGGDRVGLGWPEDRADNRRQPDMPQGVSMAPQQGPVDEFMGFGSDAQQHRNARPAHGGDSAGGEAPKPWARAPPERAVAAPAPDNHACERCFWLLALFLVVVIFVVPYFLRSDPIPDDYEEIVGSHRPTPPFTPIRETELPDDCNVPGDLYMASPVCSPAVRREWARLSSIPRQQDVCDIDYATGRIVCDTKVQCEGGTATAVDRVQTKRTMDYDCSKCPDIQRGSCCGKCKELQDKVSRGALRIGGEGIHEVLCHNCAQADLAESWTAASASAVSCSHNHADGTFKCTLKEHCESGAQRIDMQNLSFACLVTPCDTCQDTFAKAQCCLTCLENYCNSNLDFVNRKVCRGCHIDPSRLPAA